MVFCAPISTGIEGTFNALCTPIEYTLRDFGYDVTRGCLDGAFCDGAHNNLADGRKFAGTAQRQRRCKHDPRKVAALAYAVLLTRALDPRALRAINTFRCHLGRPGDVIGDRHADVPRVVNQRDLIVRLDHYFTAPSHGKRDASIDPLPPQPNWRNH